MYFDIKKYQFYILGSLFILINYACRKYYKFDNPTQLSRTELFFKTNGSLSKEIQAVYNKLKVQNDRTHFVEKLPIDAGNPIWSKIKIFEKNKTSRSTNNDSAINAIIPLTTNNTQLSSLLKIVGSNSSDTFSLSIFTNNYFYNKTHGATVDINKAQYLIGLFLMMDNEAFNTTVFNNIPKTCYPSINFSNNTKSTTSIKLDSIFINNSGRLVGEPCWDITYETVDCATPNLACCQPDCDLIKSGSCGGSGPEECKWVNVGITICPGGDDPGEPVGGGSGMGTGTGTGTSTGSGSGTSGGSNPCSGAWYRTTEPCESGGIGFTPNPCDPFIINTLAQDSNFAAKFAYLNSNAVLGSGKEHGYKVPDRSANNYNYQVGPDASKMIQWSFPAGEKVEGLLHSHYYGLNSVFSTNDLYLMADLYLSGFAKDSTNFYFGLTSNNGLPLLIKVKNTTKFRKFANELANEYKKGKLDKFDATLTLFDADKQIAALFKMITKLKGEGAMDIYESNSPTTCNTWKKLAVDNFGEVSRTNCN